MRQAVEEVHVDEDIEDYITKLVQKTRQNPQIDVGASPRGSLTLLKLARANAALDGRDYVLPDDVKMYAIPALTHRLILKPDLWMKRNAATEVLTTILNTVPVPVIEGI
jgi:MoxR-like ATPase